MKRGLIGVFVLVALIGSLAAVSAQPSSSDFYCFDKDGNPSECPASTTALSQGAASNVLIDNSSCKYLRTEYFSGKKGCNNSECLGIAKALLTKSGVIFDFNGYFSNFEDYSDRDLIGKIALAVCEMNVSWCEKIADDAKGDCITFMAWAEYYTSKGNLAQTKKYCDLVKPDKNGKYKDWQYSRQLDENDKLITLLFYSPGSCLSSVALKNNKVAVCRLINKKDYSVAQISAFNFDKRTCFGQLAIKNKDVAFCKNLKSGFFKSLFMSKENKNLETDNYNLCLSEYDRQLNNKE